MNRKLLAGILLAAVFAGSLAEPSSGGGVWTVRSPFAVHRLLVAGSTVVAANDGGEVASLSLATGRLAWKADLGYNSHSLRLASADGVLFAGDAGNVTALRLADGEVLWRRAGIGFPLAAENGLLVGLVQAGPPAATGYPPFEFYLADAGTGEVRWQVPSFGYASARFYGNVVMVAADGLHGLDRQSGEEIWHSRFPAYSKSVLASEAAYGFPRDPKVGVQRADPSTGLVSILHTGPEPPARYIGTVAVSQDLAAVQWQESPSTSILQILDLKNPDFGRTVELEEFPFFLALQGKTILGVGGVIRDHPAGGLTFRARAIDAETGTTKWTVEFPGGNGVAVSPFSLVLGVLDSDMRESRIMSIDLATGEHRENPRHFLPNPLVALSCMILLCLTAWKRRISRDAPARPPSRKSEN